MTDHAVSSPPVEVIRKAEALGLSLGDALVGQLGEFLSRLLRTNQAFNLTAITDAGEAWERHILDSLSLVPFLRELPPGSRVADVGSGGGLPAIPLACAFSSVSFALVEATGKKARFLDETARALGLGHVSVAAVRAEDFGRGPARESFDRVTARAVSRLPVLLELTLPLLRVGGKVLAIKGAQALAEIDEAQAALRVLGGVVETVKPTATGHIVVVAKEQSSPARYPRRPGEPKRSPLS